MDKSETETLEEWDMVSSVYDTEQDNNVTEKKMDGNSTNGNTDSSTNSNIETSTNVNDETSTDEVTETSISAIRTDSSVKISETDTEETAVTIKPADVDTTSKVVSSGEIEIVEDEAEETVQINVVETAETDTKDVTETVAAEIVKADIRETDQVNHEEVVVVDSKEMAGIDTEKTVEVDAKETIEVDTKETVEVDTAAEADIEETVEVDTEEASEPETEEITVIETIMYDVKKISDIDTERATKTNIEKITYANIEKTTSDNIENTDNVGTKPSDDFKVEECYDSSADKNVEADAIYKSETNVEPKIDANMHSAVDNCEDKIVNSSLDSSMEHIQMEQCEGSCIQNLPELIPHLTEQENAALESSSSDIDIIDENMEESVTHSFLHPLSLSITSAVDTSTILSSPSDDDKDVKTDDLKLPEKSESYPKSKTLLQTSEVYPEKLETYSRSESCSVKSETIPKRSDYEYQRFPHDERRENIHHSKSQPSPPRAQCSIFGIILQFLRNMTRLEWSLLGGVVLGLYFTVVFNQTNIFAVVEKDDVVSQMKKMIDELKYDNKLLKDQMLSEMKNDKVFSSFENQIKELRKENSRLNHMMYDVVKVLEKQKDSQDRFEKGAEYLEPFKKEINKLKEHINILKFDNEELQKQLVRMRYSSYSQGGSERNDGKAKEQKEETKAHETSSTDEIPLDINSLKKWNDLVSLLSKELGLLSKNDPLMKEKYQSYTLKNVSWFWKKFLNEFKGTFEEFRANITSKFLDYKKVHENTVSNIYKSIKHFFTVEEQNKKPFIPPGEESSQWENFGDFFNELKDKWTRIKNRIDTSDLRKFFEDLKMPGHAKTSQDYNAQKSESSSFDHNERKPTNVPFESERKPTNGHFESERKPTNTHFESQRKPANVRFQYDKKPDKVQSDAEDAKWMFDRAAVRAELRDTEKEDDSVNWYLKKNKHLSKDTEKNKY